MVAEQEIKKTLNGNSGVKAPVLRPNVEGLFSLIPLTQGKFAIVDAKNYQWLNQYKWYAIKTKWGYYAGRVIKGSGDKRVLMHREILDVPKEFETDHKNHNSLDNRENNIRIVTTAENQHNQQLLRKNGSSQYKGVCWHKRLNKWLTRIKINGKSIHLGLFNNEIKAAKAYDKKATELFGEFAFTNF